MREAMRVDLRNGRAVRALSATSTPPLGGHPAVRRVVQAAMREQAPGPFADGNWGLWNFGGQGPLGEPPAAVVGKPGECAAVGRRALLCSDTSIVIELGVGSSDPPLIQNVIPLICP